MGSTGYSRKEPIGQCFAEKNDAKGLVALHKYYHDGLSAHLYTTDKDDVDLDQCEYEGIMCYVYPPEQTEQEQSSVASALLSSFIEATTDQPLLSSSEMAEEDCDKLPVYLYWSELYENSLYIPHNQSPPSSYKSYVLIDKMFSFYWQDCEKKGNVVLFQCRTEENGDYTDSILSESPDFECTDRTGYTLKEPIGRCFANKNDAEGLVALQKYYHDALDAHLYTTDKDDVDLDECKYEGIACYVYPPEQTQQSLFSSIPATIPKKKNSVAPALLSSFIETTTSTSQPTPAPTAEPSPAPTNAPSSSPRSAKKGLLKVTEQEVPPSPIDVIIMLNSSGSVADADFSNWQAEIDYAASMVDAWVDSGVITVDVRVALINYSGCHPKYTFEECQKKNKLKLEWGLTATKEEMLARLDSMGPDDFQWGYSWTDEALSVALAEFEASSGADHEKWIVLLTNGEPTYGHEACRTTDGFMSETVVALKALGVEIYTGAISMTQGAMDEYFSCLGPVNAKESFDDLSHIMLRE